MSRPAILAAAEKKAGEKMRGTELDSHAADRDGETSAKDYHSSRGKWLVNAKWTASQVGLQAEVLNGNADDIANK